MVGVSRSLLLCGISDTAVYRLPIAGLEVTGTVHELQLVAGLGVRRELANRDGQGEGARFTSIEGMAVDGSGTAWIVDVMSSQPERRVRLARMEPGGHVSTAPVDLAGPGLEEGVGTYHTSPTVLRNGCLALMPFGYPRLVLLQLGLTPPWASTHTSPPPSPSRSTSITLGPGPGPTLSADLGALLDRQPDGSADVEVEVGGQVFAAHRSVLAARSPYFRQRLDPGAGFADGGALRLSLPDADPAAFGAVLRSVHVHRQHGLGSLRAAAAHGGAGGSAAAAGAVQRGGRPAAGACVHGERGGAAAVGGAAQRQLRGAAGGAQVLVPAAPQPGVGREAVERGRGAADGSGPADFQVHLDSGSGVV